MGQEQNAHVCVHAHTPSAHSSVKSMYWKTPGTACLQSLQALNRAQVTQWLFLTPASGPSHLPRALLPRNFQSVPCPETFLRGSHGSLHPVCIGFAHFAPLSETWPTVPTFTPFLLCPPYHGFLPHLTKFPPYLSDSLSVSTH